MVKNNRITSYDIAYQEIRNAIISGYYRSGERLIESDIAEKLELSRTPVREALKQLEKDGFLVSEPYKGMMVKKYSSAELKNYYQVRSVLEALCGYLVAKNSTDEDKDYFLQNIAKSKVALVERDYKSLARLNDELHTKLTKATGNELLIKMLENLRSYSAIMRIALMTIPSRPQKVIEEHEKIVEAVIKGKKILAAKRSMDHMINSWKKSKEIMSNVE